MFWGPSSITRHGNAQAREHRQRHKLRHLSLPVYATSLISPPCYSHWLPSSLPPLPSLSVSGCLRKSVTCTTLFTEEWWAQTATCNFLKTLRLLYPTKSHKFSSSSFQCPAEESPSGFHVAPKTFAFRFTLDWWDQVGVSPSEVGQALTGLKQLRFRRAAWVRSWGRDRRACPHPWSEFYPEGTESPAAKIYMRN